MGAAENRNKSQAHAEYMKRMGIKRSSGRCPICFNLVGIPMDRHFFGQVCSPRRKGAVVGRRR
jgi:hypothetical protein